MSVDLVEDDNEDYVPEGLLDAVREAEETLQVAAADLLSSTPTRPAMAATILDGDDLPLQPAGAAKEEQLFSPEMTEMDLSSPNPAANLTADEAKHLAMDDVVVTPQRNNNNNITTTTPQTKAAESVEKVAEVSGAAEAIAAPGAGSNLPVATPPPAAGAQQLQKPTPSPMTLQKSASSPISPPTDQSSESVRESQTEYTGPPPDDDEDDLIMKTRSPPATPAKNGKAARQRGQKSRDTSPKTTPRRFRKKAVAPAPLPASEPKMAQNEKKVEKEGVEKREAPQTVRTNWARPPEIAIPSNMFSINQFIGQSPFSALTASTTGLRSSPRELPTPANKEKVDASKDLDQGTPSNSDGKASHRSPAPQTTLPTAAGAQTDIQGSGGSSPKPSAPFDPQLSPVLPVSDQADKPGDEELLKVSLDPILASEQFEEQAASKLKSNEEESGLQHGEPEPSAPTTEPVSPPKPMRVEPGPFAPITDPLKPKQVEPEPSAPITESVPPPKPKQVEPSTDPIEAPKADVQAASSLLDETDATKEIEVSTAQAQEKVSSTPDLPVPAHGVNRTDTSGGKDKSVSLSQSVQHSSTNKARSRPTKVGRLTVRTKANSRLSAPVANKSSGHFMQVTESYQSKHPPLATERKASKPASKTSSVSFSSKVSTHFMQATESYQAKHPSVSRKGSARTQRKTSAVSGAPSRLMQPTASSAAHQYQKPMNSQQRAEEARAQAKERIRQRKLRSKSTPKPRLTIPITPKFATDARCGSKVAARKTENDTPPLAQSTDTLRKGLRDDHAVVPTKTPARSAPTIPKTPRFATTARYGAKLQSHQAPASLAQSADAMRKGLRDIAPSAERRKRLTVPKSPNLRTSARKSELKSASTDSSEQSERKGNEENQANVSLERKENRPKRRLLTTPKPFSFLTDRRAHTDKRHAIEEKEKEEPVQVFKARPVPKCIKSVSKSSNVRRVHPEPDREDKPVPVFRARPIPKAIHKEPNLPVRQTKATSPRNYATPILADSGEPEYAFRARPVPVSVYKEPSVPIKMANTAIAKPIGLGEEPATPFRARPVPKSVYQKPSLPVRQTKATSPRNNIVRLLPDNDETDEEPVPFKARKMPNFEEPKVPEDEASSPFKARAVPAGVYSAPSVPVRMTKTFSPRRVVSSEQVKQATEDQHFSFRARSVPKSTYVRPTTSPSKSKTTSTRPFNLSPPRSDTRHGLIESSLRNAEALEREKENEARRRVQEKHLQALRASSSTRLSPTEINAFKLRTDSRHEIYEKNLQKKLLEEEEERRKLAEYKASPLPTSFYRSPTAAKSPSVRDEVRPKELVFDDGDL